MMARWDYHIRQCLVSYAHLLIIFTLLWHRREFAGQIGRNVFIGCICIGNDPASNIFAIRLFGVGEGDEERR